MWSHGDGGAPTSVCRTCFLLFWIRARLTRHTVASANACAPQTCVRIDLAIAFAIFAISCITFPSVIKFTRAHASSGSLSARTHTKIPTNTHTTHNISIRNHCGCVCLAAKSLPPSNRNIISRFTFKYLKQAVR